MTKRSLLLLGLAACGGDDGAIAPPAPDAGDLPDSGNVGNDAAAQPDVSMPVEAAAFPAFTPWMGQLTHNGGPLLTSPVVVTITWDGDAAGRATFEGFGDGLGASSYWAGAVGEYGVGATTSGPSNHVHVTTTPPAQMTDSDIRGFIGSNLGSLLPAWTSQTIYVVYMSKSTELVSNGQNACNFLGGYHDSFSAGGNEVAYAVLPRCGSDFTVTQAASHEIGEASTDPHPGNPGLRSFDGEWLAFELWQRNNDENGDACEFFPDSRYLETTPFTYEVQRLWSNKQGPLGHSPCQPFTGVYFNVAPLALQDLTVDLGSGPLKTKGYSAKQGDTIPIDLGFYSDAPMVSPITLYAYESNPLVNPVTGRLTLAVNPAKKSGFNGEQTFVNVTVTMAGPQKVELLTLETVVGGSHHYLPLLISNP